MQAIVMDTLCRYTVLRVRYGLDVVWQRMMQIPFILRWLMPFLFSLRISWACLVVLLLSAFFNALLWENIKSFLKKCVSVCCFAFSITLPQSESQWTEPETLHVFINFFHTVTFFYSKLSAYINENATLQSWHSDFSHMQ